MDSTRRIEAKRGWTIAFVVHSFTSSGSYAAKKDYEKRSGSIPK
jgi:RecA-family ATPase